MSDDNLSLKVTSVNGVKVYHCSSGKSLTEWQKEYKGRTGSLKYNDAFNSRVELLQDFSMPVAATRVKVSPDGRYVAALGTYKPRMRLYDTENLSMKVERVTDADMVQVQFLTDDMSKMIVGRNDRILELHGQRGMHTKVRVPKFIHDLLYHRPTCDAYIGCNGSEVYRLNLEQGSFLAPLVTSFEEGVNCMGYNPKFPLLAFGGGEGGRAEMWDPRDRTRACIFDIKSSLKQHYRPILNAMEGSDVQTEVTALRFSDSGMHFSCGTSTGQVLTYDIRMNNPLYANDHKLGKAIHSVKYHPNGQLFSADDKMVKIWNSADGSQYTSVTAPYPMNDLCLVGSSGLMFMACDAPSMHSYYIPSIGSVPNWCAHLEMITEELEETKSNDLYDDYKFVTKEELLDWGLGHLVGTNLLRAYLHGYFIDARLYNEVKTLTEETNGDYEGYLKTQAKRKIDEERMNRISAPSKGPAINQNLAESLSKKRKMIDPRFGSVFDDDDFVINEDSEEYKRQNPHVKERKVVSGEVKSIAQPQKNDDSSVHDQLDDEMNTVRTAAKQTEARGILAASGLEEPEKELSVKEQRKKEREARNAKRESEAKEDHTREAREMLMEQDKKSKLALFARSISEKHNLKTLKAGLDVGDVLTNTKRNTGTAFLHMSLGDRVRAEEHTRRSTMRDRSQQLRQDQKEAKVKETRKEEAMKLARRTMSHSSMRKEGMRTKGSKNDKY